MSSDTLRSLGLGPLRSQDLEAAQRLFVLYPYKDFQLAQLKIPKEKMAGFLMRSLKGQGVVNAGLSLDGQLEGLASARSLPWMSQLMGARMYSLQHFLTAGLEPGHFASLVAYLRNYLEEADFLDCRVAAGDINAIQALEDSGFRFVGNEVYLVRSLERDPVDDTYDHPECEPCPPELKPAVMDLVRETHFHNRYMYDPEVPADQAAEIYSRYLAGFAFAPDFRSLIVRQDDQVMGFIFYKYNNALSELVGGAYASLDFIGVSRRVQNRGLGDMLNRAALHDLARSGVTHVVVRTFGSNYPAIRILQKVDFKITSSDLHFHHWVHSRAKARRSLHSSGQPFVAASAVG